MDSLTTLFIFLLLVLIVAVPYWRGIVKHKRAAEKNLERNVRAGMQMPVTLHPHIDLLKCIGCASCVQICPEHVLGIVDGRAHIISGMKCVGHAVCAEVCPVGAITMGFGTPGQGMEIPYYDGNYETNVRGLYVIGELGGVGLIKNAVTQGMKAVDHIAGAPRRNGSGGCDLLIVGAGPAGLSAALSAHARNLRYVLLEQGQLGGALLHYPRKKLVLTSPVELPLYGRLKVSEISKEDLLGMWMDIAHKYQLNVKTGMKVESVQKAGDQFTISCSGGTFQAPNVVLALGRRGSPRRLDVPGEDQPKVMYHLIEAETYQRKNVLVVGGGDSAVEAAIALERQPGNAVTLSYRKAEFVRLRTQNEERIRTLMTAGKILVVFGSRVVEITRESVVLQEGEKPPSPLPNDHVFVFAGGELPSELLKKAGIRMRSSEVESAAA